MPLAIDLAIIGGTGLYKLAAMESVETLEGDTVFGSPSAPVRIGIIAGRRVEGIDADYIALEVPDRYVYGYGMNYYEQGRNLPGIYALGH